MRGVHQLLHLLTLRAYYVHTYKHIDNQDQRQQTHATPQYRAVLSAMSRQVCGHRQLRTLFASFARGQHASRDDKLEVAQALRGLVLSAAQALALIKQLTQLVAFVARVRADERLVAQL